MIYLDANIFLFAALDRRDKGRRARELLKKVQDGREAKAATSTLTYDEFFWIVKKYRGFNLAVKATKALLEMPNLIFLSVDEAIIRKALALVEAYKLNPRDSIHAASAINHNISIIFSEDKDFDRVKELKRKSLS